MAGEDQRNDGGTANEENQSDQMGVQLRQSKDLNEHAVCSSNQHGDCSDISKEGKGPIDGDSKAAPVEHMEEAFNGRPNDNDEELNAVVSINESADHNEKERKLIMTKTENKETDLLDCGSTGKADFSYNITVGVKNAIDSLKVGISERKYNQVVDKEVLEETIFRCEKEDLFDHKVANDIREASVSGFGNGTKIQGNGEKNASETCNKNIYNESRITANSLKDSCATSATQNTDDKGSVSKVSDIIPPAVVCKEDTSGTQFEQGNAQRDSKREMAGIQALLEIDDDDIEIMTDSQIELLDEDMHPVPLRYVTLL